MDPDKPTIETEQRRFGVAFTNIDEWIEEQKRNKIAGRVDINLEHLIEIVSDFFSAARSMHMLETDEIKKTEFSKIEAKLKEVLDGLGLITEMYEQVDLYIAAKRLLLQAHEEAKKLLPQ